jgi:uncharacterized protein
VSSRPDSPTRFCFRNSNIHTADSTARSIDTWNGFRGAVPRVSNVVLAIVVVAIALVISTATSYCASAEEPAIFTNKVGSDVNEEGQAVTQHQIAEQSHLFGQNQTAEPKQLVEHKQSAEPNQTAELRHSEQKQHIAWQKWSNDIFEIAVKQNKRVLLDLEAVWCHWCHVMEEKTYHDSAIIKLINTNYLPVKVDQDSRPDLSNRYEDYGWPATIVFSKDGKELQKLQGYIPVKDFLPILKDPEGKHGEDSGSDQSLAAADQQILSAAEQDLSIDQRDVSVNGQLTKAVQAELEQRHKDGYDTKNGGWGFGHKFLYRDTLEYSIGKARSGDKVEEKKAQETLKLEQQLLDPVWGGIYQYSTHNDWKHAHFEKIMEVQAGNMRIYSLAYLYWKDPTYLHVAEEIARYLNTFLRSSDGAFYTSQDADVVQGKHSDKYFSLDDSKRRKQGIPRIDQHIYSRENGWVIQALIGLYQASGKSNYLQQAEAAANWIERNRSLRGGGFKHDNDASTGPYLGDTLAMGRAFLALYTATGNRQWYERAKTASVFIHDHFLKQEEGGPKHVPVGVMTGVPTNPADVTYNLDENVDVARFANLLYRYSGKENDRELAQAAMRYLALPKIALSRQNLVGGVLLANAETSSEPVHITTVGKKSDADAAKFFFTSQTFPSAYKRVDWFDEAEGALPNTDITYPKLAQSAAFLCGKNACSPPIRSTERLSEMMARISHPEVSK